MQGSFVTRSPLRLLRPPSVYCFKRTETIQMDLCDSKGYTHTGFVLSPFPFFVVLVFWRARTLVCPLAFRPPTPGACV